MKRACLVVLAFGAALFVPSSGHAAPPDRCAAEQSGWTYGSVEEVAAIIWEGLIEPLPFPSEEELRAVLEGLDRNQDGICLNVLWGERPNPNAHWWNVEFFTVRDDHTKGH